MTRVALSRLPGERVLAVDGDSSRELAMADLAAYVEARERDGTRWVWDDTARWYPPLAGGRCARRALPRPAARVTTCCVARLPSTTSVAGREQSEHWDRLGPTTPSDPPLLWIDDTAEHLRADLEDTPAAGRGRGIRRLSRLDLLLAAESAGALSQPRCPLCRRALARRRPRAPAPGPARATAAARCAPGQARGARGARCGRPSTRRH